MGHKIFWLNVTDMKTEYGYTAERVEKRAQEIECVKKAYGFDGFWNMGLEPAGMDKYETGFLITEFKKVFEEVQPEMILMPYRYDIHSDHRVVYDVVYSCAKSFRMPCLKTILSMEILSETDQAQNESGFVPNIFIDISQYIDRKIEIMRIYESEIDEAPFPRNEDAIRGLAAYRGATAYYKCSEAFYLVKGRID